jgi:hypothetical protein
MRWHKGRELAAGRAAAATVATTALAVAGCGGSGKAPPSVSPKRAAGPATAHQHHAQPRRTSESLARSHLIAKAIAICRRVNLEVTASPHRVDTRKIASGARRNAAIERRAVGELARLPPVESLVDDWKRLVAYRQTLAAQLVELAQYAEAGDTHAIQTLAASKARVHQELSKLASRDGFGECADVSVTRIFGSPLHLPPNAIKRAHL